MIRLHSVLCNPQNLTAVVLDVVGRSKTTQLKPRSSPLPRAIGISLLIIALTVPIRNLEAQELWKSDPELAALVEKVGNKKAVDSCLKVLDRTAAALASAKMKVTEDEKGWLPVRCAKWVGLLGDQRAMPTLGKILTFKRTKDEYTKEGSFLRSLQEQAFRSRVQLMILAGKTDEAFDGLIAEFKRAGQRNELPLHNRDMIDFAMGELATRDELFPLLLNYARTSLLPIPTLPAENMEALRRYEEFERLKRVASISTRQRRDAVLHLVTSAEQSDRELGLELLDYSEATADELITLMKQKEEPAKSSIRLALETMQQVFKRRIDQKQKEMAGLQANTSAWEAAKQEMTKAMEINARIEKALNE